MTRSRPGGGLLVLIAIILLAFNLRLSVNALGSLLPEIRADLGLSASAAGVLNAFPTIIFALVGLAAPAIAGFFGIHRAVVVALLTAIGGQALRVWGGGPFSLYAGTFLTLSGVAVGNVLLPGLVRLHFREKLTTLTAVYATVLVAGAAVGSGLTIPLQQAFDGDWHTGIGLWGLFTVAALVPWVLVAANSGQRANASPPNGSAPDSSAPDSSAPDSSAPDSPAPARTGPGRSSISLRLLLASGLAWTMAGFFGVQTAQAYVAVGWLGQVLTDAGIAEVRMGFLLAVIPAISIPLSVLIPLILRRQDRMKYLILGLACSYAAGYIGLMTAPAGGALFWMMLIGIGTGTFPLVLTLFALRASTPDGVIALSAFAQCFGYLMGSVGPLAFGFLHDLADSWQASLGLMLASMIPLTYIGLKLVRQRYLEDEISIR